MAREADVEAVRDEVGTDPTDDIITTYLDRGLTVNGSALAILKRRLADFTTKAQSIEVQGDASLRYDLGNSLKAIQAQVNRLQNLVDAEDGQDDTGLPVVTVGRLCRQEPWR